jgi:hypothetical protein
MKKANKLFAIIGLSIILCLTLLFFISNIIWSNPQKVVEKTINEFFDNESVFVAVKDFLVSSGYDSDMYITSINYSELALNDSEHEYFEYIFEKMKYKSVVYYVEHEIYVSVIVFQRSSKPTMSLQIEYTGNEEDISRNANGYTNLGNGWHFYWFGGV